jgi:hypothetical protein
MKKQPFNLDQHRRLGRELHAIRNTLLAISCDLANKYGKSGPVAKLAEDARRVVDRLRQAMEAHAVTDSALDFDGQSLPGFLHVYFPGSGEGILLASDAVPSIADGRTLAGIAYADEE